MEIVRVSPPEWAVPARPNHAADINPAASAEEAMAFRTRDLTGNVFPASLQIELITPHTTGRFPDSLCSTALVLEVNSPLTPVTAFEQD